MRTRKALKALLNQKETTDVWKQMSEACKDDIKVCFLSVLNYYKLYE